MNVSVIEVSVWLVLSILMFGFGYGLGYINSKKKTLGQIDWFSHERCFKMGVIYRVMGMVNIFSNEYAVILRDGKYWLLAVVMPDFDLKNIRDVKYVRLSLDGKSFEPACLDDVPSPPPKENPVQSAPPDAE